MSKKLKHNKIKNTGIIWELLVRQVTTDMINDSESYVKDIIKEFFQEGTEISKEHQIYQVLLNTKMKNTSSINSLIDETLKEVNKIDINKLKKEKYNLIKKLKEKYDVNEFFKTKIPNYRTLATIYKLLEIRKEDEDIITETGEVSMLRENLINHIDKNNNKNTQKQKYRQRAEELIEKDNNTDNDVGDYVNKKMAFKIMIEKFNQKYNDLNKNQKEILKMFIEKPSNSTEFRNKIKETIKESKKKIKDKLDDIKTKSTKIKINHAMKTIEEIEESIDKGNIITNNKITNVLLFEEIKNQVENI